MLLLTFIVFLGAYANFGAKKEQGKQFETNAQMESSNGLSEVLVPELPWEEDINFKEAKSVNDTPLLLAKFEVTLIDPLPGELYNAKLGVSQLAGTVLKPGEVFSQNNRLGPYTEAKGYQKGPTYFGGRVGETVGGGVCKIATLLYNVAILTNLQIIERHHHSMPVPYVPPGQDATVAYGVKDIKFKNNTNETLLIWAGSVEENFMIAIYGKTSPPKVNWEHRLLQETPFQKIYQQDASIPKGTEKILMKGVKGSLVETKLTIEYSDGRIEERPMGRSWYNPMPEVILKGSGES